jgi:hypothetical protein
MIDVHTKTKTGSQPWLPVLFPLLPEAISRKADGSWQVVFRCS